MKWAPVVVTVVVVAVLVGQGLVLLRILGALRRMARQLAVLGCVQSAGVEIDRLMRRVIDEG